MKRTATPLVLLALSLAAPAIAQERDGCDWCGLRSVGGGGEHELIVRNRADDGALTLWWIDFDGQPVRYAEIAAADRHVQPTYAGHVWLIENEDDGCDALLRVEGDVTITVR